MHKSVSIKIKIKVTKKTVSDGYQYWLILKVLELLSVIKKNKMRMFYVDFDQKVFSAFIYTVTTFLRVIFKNVVLILLSLNTARRYFKGRCKS